MKEIKILLDEVSLNCPPVKSMTFTTQKKVALVARPDLSQVAHGAESLADTEAASDCGEFSTLEAAPATHMFYGTPYQVCSTTTFVGPCF